MYRFNPPDSSRTRKSACHGFTLIELLVATSSVAVLVALLLPVIQTRREEYASNKAKDNLTAMMLASQECMRRRGSYPTSIQDLFQFCSANPGDCSLDPQLATGRAGGYNVIMANTEGDFHITVEPQFPGITASITHTYDADTGVINSTPTPGADAARQQAFNDILLSGARTAVDLLVMDPNSIAQIRSYTGSIGVNQGVVLGDFDGDGDVDGADFLSTNNTYKGPFPTQINGFVAAVYRDLRCDTLNDQDRLSIRVNTSDITGDASAALFSYDALRQLTALMITNPDGTGTTILNALTAKLDEAEAAEASGNEKRKAKALKQYRKWVKSERNHTFTRADSNVLMTLSDVMVSR